MPASAKCWSAGCGQTCQSPGRRRSTVCSKVQRVQCAEVAFNGDDESRTVHLREHFETQTIFNPSVNGSNIEEETHYVF